MEKRNVIELEGSMEKIVLQLGQAEGIAEEDGKKIINFLEKNLQILSDDETFRKVKQRNLGLGYALPGYEYYVNIKITTLAILIFILDCNVTGGILSKISSLVGITENAIFRMKEESGERCILKELALQKKKQGDKSLLRKFKGECCNNDLKCCYRSDEKCYCREEDVEKILVSFEERNIVKKKGKKYQIQF